MVLHLGIEVAKEQRVVFLVEPLATFDSFASRPTKLLTKLLMPLGTVFSVTIGVR